MRVIVISFVISFMNIVDSESFGQLAVNQEKIKSDTTSIVASNAKGDSIPSRRIYNDLPRMPKKKEPSNKLFREDKKVIKKGNVKRKYKHEGRVETRLVKKRDKKHGIIAERKKKDKMFK
jgi:hypothetical protein